MARGVASCNATDGCAVDVTSSLRGIIHRDDLSGDADGRSFSRPSRADDLPRTSRAPLRIRAHDIPAEDNMQTTLTRALLCAALALAAACGDQTPAPTSPAAAPALSRSGI